MHRCMENKTVLITGATGLIGQALIRKLLSDKDRPAKILALTRNRDRAEVIFSDFEKTDRIVKIDIGAKHGENTFEYRIEAKEGSDIRKELFIACAENGFYILEMKSSELTLEDIFLRLTMGGSINGGEE